MFGMSSDQIAALAAVAQAILALVTLIGSIAVSLFIWYGTRRIAQLDYERSLREAWMAVDAVALSSDEMLVMADTLMDPKNAASHIEARRRRWFAYTLMNAIVSTYFGAKHGFTQSRKDSLEACRQLLRPLMNHDEIFEITQGHGYEPEFSALCREVREEQIRNSNESESVFASQDRPASAQPSCSTGRKPANL